MRDKFKEKYDSQTNIRASIINLIIIPSIIIKNKGFNTTCYIDFIIFAIIFVCYYILRNIKYKIIKKFEIK